MLLTEEKKKIPTTDMDRQIIDICFQKEKYFVFFLAL